MSKLLWLLEYPTVNGGEHSLVATIPWVRAAGFDVAALVPAPSAAASLLTATGVRVVPAPSDVTDGGMRLPLAERRARLAEALTTESPDLVVANSLSMARLAGPVTSELGLPAGGHLRDIVGLSPAAVDDVNRLDRLWAVSQATRDYHVAQGVAADKLRVLYNGIDTAQFRPRPRTGHLVAELGLPSDARIIATIGQLVQRKGVDVALDAFIAAAGDLPGWQLVIVGERYSQKEEARQFEVALHQRRDRSEVPDRIHFLGRREDVGELLPEIDLLVHSARQEPLGRVLLEAAACGLPVVASDVGGTREVFEIADSADRSVVGLISCELVPSGNVVALATAIRRLAGDTPLREHLSSAARRLAKSRFDIRVRGPAIVAAYRELLAPLARSRTRPPFVTTTSVEPLITTRAAALSASEIAKEHLSMATHTDRATARTVSPTAPPSSSSLFEEYRRLTGKSAQLAERARKVFPSGITHDSRFLEPYPLYVEHAAGSHKWDVDGREYVDYTGGHGALLLGHNHPRIVAAIEEQLRRGTHYGSGHELEIRWGELVQQLLPSAERVRFTSSGTEATLLALRLARAATGKQKIVRFAGHFHGWHDHVAFGLGPDNRPLSSPGVLPELAEQMIIAPPNDAAALQRIFAENPDVAAVILEPTGGSWGQTPIVPEFLRELRELTARRGVLLIFDEVISGFRVAPGGAQQHFGIRPDLTTLAKILAGGLPGGAVAGREDVLEALAFPSAAGPRRDKVPHHGTYNANPLSAAAGIATLELVATTDACQQANDYAARLRARLQQVVDEAGAPWIVYGTFSGFHVFTNPEGQTVTAADIASGRCDWRSIKAPAKPGLTSKLRVGMILHGVEIFSWPGGPTSAVHSDEDLERTVAAFRGTLRRLQDEGEF